MGVHLHGARGGAKALVFKRNGFLLRRTRGGGSKEGKEQKEEELNRDFSYSYAT